MYSFTAPRDFVDETNLEIESEWNPHYDESDVPSSPQEPSSPSSGLLYECYYCMTSHSPGTPCNASHYTLSLPQNASYSYEAPLYVEHDLSQNNHVIEANYRKWLVSVSPR